VGCRQYGDHRILCQVVANADSRAGPDSVLLGLMGYALILRTLPRRRDKMAAPGRTVSPATGGNDNDRYHPV
jgi:hypothetical protein